MQGTRFHAERPRVGYPQLAHDEREHSLGIRLTTGLSLTLEYYDPLLFETRFGTETNSSGSAREAVWVGVRQARDRCSHPIQSSLWL